VKPNPFPAGGYIGRKNTLKITVPFYTAGALPVENSKDYLLAVI
jgi:hypothetical protein